MSDEKTTVFKPAYLTKAGVVEITGKLDLEGRFQSSSWAFYYVGRDVFMTREEALTAAMAERDRRLVSLRKQIAKIEKRAYA